MTCDVTYPLRCDRTSTGPLMRKGRTLVRGQTQMSLWPLPLPHPTSPLSTLTRHAWLAGNRPPPHTHTHASALLLACPTHCLLGDLCFRILGDGVIPLPHIYGSRIKGVEVFCPLDPPPPYEVVAGSSTDAARQVHSEFNGLKEMLAV